MKSIAVAVIVGLVLPPSLWAQEISRESLRDAAARGGCELAAASVATPDDRWARVRRLTPGTLVRVVTTDGRSQDVRFVIADPRTLVAVSVEPLPAAARAELLDLVKRYPGALPVAGRQVTHGKLQLDPSAVFFDGTRIADLPAVEITFAKGDVATVKTRGANPRSAIGAVIGGVAGGLIALQMIPGLAMKPCGGGCGGEKALMWLTVVGVPLAGATVGGLAVGGEQWRTIY